MNETDEIIREGIRKIESAIEWLKADNQRLKDHIALLQAEYNRLESARSREEGSRD